MEQTKKAIKLAILVSLIKWSGKKVLRGNDPQITNTFYNIPREWHETQILENMPVRAKANQLWNLGLPS